MNERTGQQLGTAGSACFGCCLWPTAWSDRVGFKRFWIEHSKSYRLIGLFIKFYREQASKSRFCWTLFSDNLRLRHQVVTSRADGYQKATCRLDMDRRKCDWDRSDPKRWLGVTSKSAPKAHASECKVFFLVCGIGRSIRRIRWKWNDRERYAVRSKCQTWEQIDAGQIPRHL